MNIERVIESMLLTLTFVLIAFIGNVFSIAFLFGMGIIGAFISNLCMVYHFHNFKEGS